MHSVCVLADDEPKVRALLKMVLEQAGFQVLEAGDGECALALIRANASRLDVVVSDIYMPQMDGIELASKLGLEFPSLPVILISGQTDRTVRPGMTLLYKPFLPAALIAAVHKATSAGIAACA